MGRNTTTTKQKKASAKAGYRIVPGKARYGTAPKPTSLEKSLFALLIFTIPTNLALGLFKDSAFVNGVMVDYLIPKLYLSDIIAILLVTAWITRVGLGKITGPYKLYNFINLTNFTSWVKLHKNEAFVLIAFLISMLISASLASKTLASYYYLAKLIEFSIITTWISSNVSHINLGKSIIPTLLFQSIVAIIQWVQKKSLLGYLFLGETTLKTASSVAKTAITGEIRPLPYGTTPHPNVLAGFIVVFILILLTHKQTPFRASPLKVVSNYLRKPSHTLTIFLGTIILFLTQSISAITALIFGKLLLYLANLPTKSRYISLLVFCCLLVVSLFLIIPKLPTESITRRIGLAKISTNMILANPIFGVGPGNFTAAMNNYGEITGTTRFIQPVHNIYLLIVSEIGLIGTTLLLIILYQSRFIITKLNLINSAPLIALLFIGILDHYPLTLQTGQLLMALVIGISINKQTDSI